MLFDALELQAPHFGLFWPRIRSEYPACQSRPPLAPSIERFEESSETTIALMEAPPIPRLWFLNEPNTRLLQLQSDRFLYNWKGAEAGDPYPHFEGVYAEFRELLEQFEAFVQDESIGQPNFRQFELTYVNHIPIGNGWSALAEVGKVMPDMSWRNTKDRYLPEPETIHWTSAFRLPDSAGRLHVKANSGRRFVEGEQQPLLRLDITARGFPKEGSDMDMKGWFDMAHEWIVRGFADLTSQEFQETIWVKVPR